MTCILRFGHDGLVEEADERGGVEGRVILLVAGKEVRILDDKHRLIRAFTLDPTRPYQPQN